MNPTPPRRRAPQGLAVARVARGPVLAAAASQALAALQAL